MKRFFFILCLISGPLFSQDTIDKWEIYHPIEQFWFPLGKSGSVQEALEQQGLLPDPFYGENEEKYQWVEEHIWKMKTKFFLTETQFNASHIDLHFPSLDTYASVFLNGEPLATSSNAFVPLTIEIRKLLKLGYNQLEIHFTPPVLYHQQRYQEESFHYPAPNDVHKISITPLTRKPQYQFGWDWALRINTIGLNAPAMLIPYADNRLTHTSIQTVSIAENEAVMKLNINFRFPLKTTLKVFTNYFDTLTLEAGTSHFQIEKKLSNPILWWPRSHGKPHVYHELLKFSNGHEEKINFGIRTSELVQERDAWGTSFVLKINGKPIFCKGADYIPEDIFIHRIDAKKIKNSVQSMVDAHFNMVRVWGGGYYPSEAFYQYCDEQGLMVWQDLMFACAMYPADSAFLSSVTQELEYQVPRISAHPSVVLWNGNNEVDVAWKNWGFQSTYHLDDQAIQQIENDYQLLFKDLAPKMIQKYCVLPYEHTSPLSNWGKSEYYDHGTQHYWGVWHGKDPITDFATKSGRFNAEYGFQSFPEWSTIASFTDEKGRSLKSADMKHHQKSYVGNGMIAKHAKLLYGKPADFQEFVYHSQLTQAKAIELAVVAHKLSAPRCMGTLYWQLNDCWPAPTWSSMDYFHQWKAVHFKVRDLYLETTVLKENEGVYFLHAEMEDTVLLNTTVFTLDGQLLAKKEATISLAPFESKSLYLETFEQYALQNYYVEFEWVDRFGVIQQLKDVHLTKKYNKAKPSAIEYCVDSIDENQKTGVLKIENSEFVADLWIYSKQLGFHLNSNFVHLLPGEHFFSFTYEHPAALDQLFINYR